MDTPGLDLDGFLILVAAFILLYKVAIRFIGSKPTTCGSSLPLSELLSLRVVNRLPNGLIVRLFCEEDFQDCTEIYESNAGEFVPPMFELFERNVKRHPSRFLVIELDGKVIACGGATSRSEQKVAWLWMGLVHRSYHGMGIGSILTLSRLAILQRDRFPILLETTAKTEPFYKKFGFIRCSEPEKRYLGEHAHFYMYRIPVCSDGAVIQELLEESGVEFRVSLGSVDVTVAEEVPV